ncbi:unnamed protein product [Parnassius mnemosyne]|uniref:Uncharacterized protein n=1 Tax=Parnassius mnemosyne TaxID=213953 RepID=A0AAV1K7W5_9NEOP
MGPEIISVIERHLGHLVDGMMCSQCFAIIMQEMSNDSVLAHGDHELQHCHDSNVYVRCRTSLFRTCAHSIPEGAERQYIAETIAPREIPEGALITHIYLLGTYNNKHT